MSIDMEQIAKQTLERMTSVAKQAYPEQIRPVYVTECGYCDGHKYRDDGSRCFYCGGKGRVASEGGEA
jgi:DnaJ-class molecular chaperone